MDEVNGLSFKRKTRKIKGIYLQLTLIVKNFFLINVNISFISKIQKKKIVHILTRDILRITITIKP